MTLRRKPRAAKRGSSAAPSTTAQQLGSLIKSTRDIMRMDIGLSSNLHRLPMLTSIMFLKFLDDLQQTEEAQSKLGGRHYRPAIDERYRRRDCAASEPTSPSPSCSPSSTTRNAPTPTATRVPACSPTSAASATVAAQRSARAFGLFHGVRPRA
jgi:type I restriction enzyme M protein